MKKPLLLLSAVGAFAALISCLQPGSANTGGAQKVAGNDVPGNSFPPGEYDSSKMINWYAKPGNSWMMQNSEGEIYLYVNIKSGKSAKAEQRVPLNLSLVLDRSGSMSGEKIEYARQAAKFVVNQLGPEDYLSIVNYDDDVEVTSISQHVKNKEALKDAIDHISDRGSTNLSGGMLEGYKQVLSTRRDGYVNRVLLLTDGLANAGIVEPRELKRLVDIKYKENNLALSTFGLGADYNEDLLTMLAESGRANYYFIATADKVPEIFARELKGLLSVVAQNAKLEIILPAGLKCEKVYGYPFEVKDDKLYMRFNDVYSNDEKAILIKLKPSRPVSGAFNINCMFSYINTDNFSQVKENSVVTIKPTSDKELIGKKQDAQVQEMLALFESTEEFDDIMAEVDNGNYEKAKDKARASLSVLNEKQKTYKSEKLQDQSLKISSYLGSLDSVRVMNESEIKLYQKSNKSMNYEVKKSKNRQ